MLQIKGESWFDYRAIGDNNTSFGCAQIKVYYVKKLMRKLDNGKLGKVFDKIKKKGKKINYIKYLFKIRYSVELLCLLMRAKLDRHNGVYTLALLDYGKGYKHMFEYTNKRFKYIENILELPVTSKPNSKIKIFDRF